MKSKFKQLYNEVGQLAAKDQNEFGLMGHIGKAAEEFGELATDVNKIVGRKKLKGNETMESVRENMKEEAADLTQCIFCILNKEGISADEFLDALSLKNQKYKKFIADKPKKKKTLLKG
jgi:NTP pyrophosphatase (non-canonical NTP hydrolase)